MKHRRWLVPTLYIIFLMLPIYWLLNMSFKTTNEILGGFSWALFQTLPVVLRLLGWFPENNDVVDLGLFEMNLVMLLLVAVKVIQGFSTAKANVGYGSMMADVAWGMRCDPWPWQ